MRAGERHLVQAAIAQLGEPVAAQDGVGSGAIAGPGDGDTSGDDGAHHESGDDDADAGGAQAIEPTVAAARLLVTVGRGIDARAERGVQERDGAHVADERAGDREQRRHDPVAVPDERVRHDDEDDPGERPARRGRRR